MLLANRRIALLHLLLALLQAGWITTFFLLVLPRALPAPAGFALVAGGLIGWMLVLELLSRAAESPLYDMLALGGLVLVSLLMAWFVLRPGSPAHDPGWLGGPWRAGTSWQGLPLAVALAGLNVLLWQRASTATSRELNFFSVGVTFRMGLLLLLLGGALLSSLRGVNAAWLLWMHLGLGLAAVAISRVSEKASESQSFGRLLPAGRLAQVALAAGAATGLTWLVSLVYTGRGIAAFFRLFDPAWQALKPLALSVVVLLGRVLNPVLLGLEAWLSRLLSQGRGEGVEIDPAAGGAPGPNVFEGLPQWPFDLARGALVGFVVIFAVIGALVFLLLYLERVRKSGLHPEAEDEGLDRATLGGGILHRTADAVRGISSLVRRFGVGRELLAAISVQNIYANLCRIARQRGHPRRVSQPPDAYLPVLAEVFPGQDERLRRITQAYMRVHYGEQAVPSEELAALREDYVSLRDVSLRDVSLRDVSLRDVSLRDVSLRDASRREGAPRQGEQANQRPKDDAHDG